ncbi:hypothetical protein [uncultured Roseobacter sp.]|uniref:hypothetical protein n=1 Tax=uncultured Roseobacter sp. TaxID=114847 RepID=UPI0026190372|nr:hypothetical protein [uncultured Roseobacter sp.]
MSKYKKAGISLVIGVILGLIVASWFGIPEEGAYYATVSLVAIATMAIGSRFGR